MNGKILLANLIIELPLVLFIVGVILLIGARRKASAAKFWIGAVLVAVPAGIVSYIASGIVAAAMRGEGHFYSVPFGGYTVDNGPLEASCAIWIALCFALVTLVARKRAR